MTLNRNTVDHPVIEQAHSSLLPLPLRLPEIITHEGMSLAKTAVEQIKLTNSVQRVGEAALQIHHFNQRLINLGRQTINLVR